VRARIGWGETRARAKEAHQNLVWWRAGDFLRNREVRDAIGAGRTDPADGHRLAVCSMTRRRAWPAGSGFSELFCRPPTRHLHDLEGPFFVAGERAFKIMGEEDGRAGSAISRVVPGEFPAGLRR
jgi:hypothetical protein